MPIRVLVGYDGSPAADAAIEAGAHLMPGARATIAHLWTPPFASEPLRRRLWSGTRHVDEFVAAIEREGLAQAERTARIGMTLARAVGWDAQELTHRCHGGEGLELAQLAGTAGTDAVLVGSRGLSGTRAILGSVSDLVVHYCPRPVLVVPHPILTAERAALAAGPVIVGWDGSPGAAAALAATRLLLPGRQVVLVAVGDEAPDGSPSSDPHGAKVLHVRAGHGPAGHAVATALRTCATEQHAAAVVVGSRGRSAIREIVLGSVVMATLHQVYRPVLVVPPQ